MLELLHAQSYQNFRWTEITGVNNDEVNISCIATLLIMYIGLTLIRVTKKIA